MIESDQGADIGYGLSFVSPIGTECVRLRIIHIDPHGNSALRRVHLFEQLITFSDYRIDAVFFVVCVSHWLVFEYVASLVMCMCVCVYIHVCVWVSSSKMSSNIERTLVGWARAEQMGFHLFLFQRLVDACVAMCTDWVVGVCVRKIRPVWMVLFQSVFIA